jgi:hypothetical protein
MERATGIEPTSEAWEARNKTLKTIVNQGQPVTYWREEPLDVDTVFEGSWGEWAIEIKTGGFELYDLKGLLEFCRRNTKIRPPDHHSAWGRVPSQPARPAGHQLEAILGRRSTSTLRKENTRVSFPLLNRSSRRLVAAVRSHGLNHASSIATRYFLPLAACTT